MDALQLFDYFHVAIAGRGIPSSGSPGPERRHRAVARIGRSWASREQIAHVPVETLLDLHDGSTEIDIVATLEEVASRNGKRDRLLHQLPQLLHDLAGVQVIPFQISQPNFVTSESVTPVLALESAASTSSLVRESSRSRTPIRGLTGSCHRILLGL